ncbi:Glycosyl transferase family 2 [Gaiella occulta]|uniref:Glycosyl transferase family 2 n=1 Tax=Gaiella occulta TaxID=1002870 RepID=A0A7M2YVV2_9ACTN|nr:glycosyltransferase [Gaiella occulta]RDI74261.1 Glycosyl transferase family 2 [Gaiella occulta]
MRFVSPISFLYPERLAGAPSAWIPHVPFAFWLVEALRPSSIVELGTHTGVSYFAFCQAVQHLGLDTRCRAIDSWLGDEHAGYYGEDIYEDVRAYNDAHYSKFSELLRMTFDEAASRFADGSVDLLHIDGCHMHEAVRHDFETWSPKLSQRAVVLFHDTNVQERGFGVFRLWDELREQYPHFEFLHGSGLGVLGWGPTGSTDINALLSLNQNAVLIAKTRAAYERLGGSLLDWHGIRDVSAEPVARHTGADRSRIDIAARDAEIERLQHETFVLRSDLDRTAAALAELRQSSTWRATAPVRSFLASRPRLTRGLRRTAKLVWWTVTFQVIRRLRERRERGRARHGARGYADWIRAYDTISHEDVEALRNANALLTTQPLISVVMPVFEPEEHFLREAIESVLAQTYENWELCIADDASAHACVQRVLDELQICDARVKMVTRKTNDGISAASNDALELASGEWIALLDHDGILRPHALFMIARTVENHPGVMYIYSDEDKIDESGARIDPYFKPDWNRTLFYSQNYICHVSAFRRHLATRCGGFRAAFDGSQNWDLFLRMTAAITPEAIHHIPHVLYHCRALPSATDSIVDAKTCAVDAATRALKDRLTADGVQADVHTIRGSYNQVRYRLPADPPGVSIVIPTTGKLRFLEQCIEGVLRRTDYPNLKVLLVLSKDAMNVIEQRSYLEEIATDPRVRLLLHDDRPFNFSWVNNWAVSQVDDSIICFLNDDTDPISEGWLRSMVGHLLQEGVGAVGAKLYYPDGTIQHAGVVLGLGGVADHLYRSLPRESDGYFGRAKLDQDLSCVTAGCMLMRKAVFDDLGGFDESWGVAFNDVDLCIRIREAGWRIVWTPSAELYHRESISLGRHDAPARRAQFEDEVRMLRERWGAILDRDPHYNPNLSLERQWDLAFPPRVAYPWRAATEAEAIDRSPR